MPNSFSLRARFCAPFVLVAALLGGGANVRAADDAPLAVQLQQDSEAQVLAASSTDPEVLWRRYLDQNGFSEGLNEREGRSFFVQGASARVYGPFGPKWVGARNTAFDKAELLAKSQLAEALSATIASTRALDMFDGGTDMAPPDRTIVELHRELSLVEKGERLMSATLDEQLRRHYPDWDGTGVDPAERQQRAASAGNALRNQMSSRARQVIQGAGTIFQAEGPNDRGDYVVMVGIVWSKDLARIARGFHDPTIAVPARSPGKSVQARLDDMQRDDPAALAAFTGVRAWRDERGRRVLVSAASHDRGSEDFITVRKNALVARDRIARFVAETIVANAGGSGGQSYREYADGGDEIFDDSLYSSQLTSTVEEMVISGVLSVRDWKGVHPVSGSPMITSVYLWAPDSAARMREFARQTTSPAENGDSRNRTGSRAPARSLIGPSATFEDF